MNTLICRNERRREAVRQRKDLNGLDYLEVGADRRTLTVYFLGKSQVALEPSNIIIEGGRRIRDIKVKEVKVTHTRMAELDDFMEVVTNKEGDFSTYIMRVVDGRDEQGSPITSKTASWLTVGFQYDPASGTMVAQRNTDLNAPNASFGEAKEINSDNYQQMFIWADSIFADSFK